MLALHEVGIPFVLFRQRRLLTQSGESDLAVSIFNQVSPMLFRLEAGLANRLIERIDDCLLFVDSEIFGIELLPRSVEAIEFGAASRQEGEPFQPFVMRQKGKHLFFKLCPGPAGDDRDVDGPEQPGQKRRHLRIEIGFALGKRAIEIEDDQAFHVSSGAAIPDLGTARSEQRRCDRTRRNADEPRCE